jgi:hypothetical protein
MGRCCGYFDSSNKSDMKMQQDDFSMSASHAEKSAGKALHQTGPEAGFSCRADPVVSISASTRDGSSGSGTVLPTFELSAYLMASAENMQSFCRSMADCLAQTGCLIVRDPRVGTAESDRFLDMMERYFSQPTQDKMADVHPELHYQVAPLQPSVVLLSCNLHDLWYLATAICTVLWVWFPLPQDGWSHH